MKRLHLVFLVIALVASEWVVVASQQDSYDARFNSPEEKAKRERKHSEIDKLTTAAAREVRENEKDWAFDKSTRGSSAPNKDNKSIVYVIDHWRNGDDAVQVHDVLVDSMDDAQQRLVSYVAAHVVGPEKDEKIAGIGDQARLLEFGDNCQLIFSKGTHCVSVLAQTTDRARSTEIAKRFAKYYDQAIASVK